MKPTIVFFDIDGTIWDERQRIPDSTVEALKLLKENGHHAFLNSGRTRAFIRERDIKPLTIDGIVAGCGTFVEIDHDIKKNVIMDEALVAKTVALLKKRHMPQVLEGCDYLYLDEEDFEGDPFLDILKNNFGAELSPLTGSENNRRINKLSVDLVDERIEETLGRLAEDFHIILHGAEFMELEPTGNTKATGMQFVADYYGIPMENTFAFGDSRNDLEMLEAAGTGVVMGNGTKEAKETGDYVTKHLKEDGIYHALEHFGLI